MTPTELRARADLLATKAATGAYIAKDQIALYVEALQALAEKREREMKRR